MITIVNPFALKQGVQKPHNQPYTNIALIQLSINKEEPPVGYLLKIRFVYVSGGKHNKIFRNPDEVYSDQNVLIYEGLVGTSYLPDLERLVNVLQGKISLNDFKDGLRGKCNDFFYKYFPRDYNNRKEEFPPPLKVIADSTAESLLQKGKELLGEALNQAYSAALHAQPPQIAPANQEAAPRGLYTIQEDERETAAETVNKDKKFEKTDNPADPSVSAHSIFSPARQNSPPPYDPLKDHVPGTTVWKKK